MAKQHPKHPAAYALRNGIGQVMTQQNAHADRREKKNNCKIEVDNNLRANDDSATLQEEGKVAGEIETAGEPPAPGNVQLRAALVGEGAQVEDSVLEGHGVEGDAVTNGPELGDRHAVRPRRRGRAAPRALWLRLCTGEAEYQNRHRRCQSHLQPARSHSQSVLSTSAVPMNQSSTESYTVNTRKISRDASRVHRKIPICGDESRANRDPGIP
jgi:hypothetical protein